MSPLVSVLMPALNEERTIAATLAAVLAQEDVDLEVLVIHGDSVDATADVVAGIAAAESRVRLLENPRSIIPAALNIGLREARGRYIARIDAHAEVSSDYLKRGVAWLERDSRLASVGGLRSGIATTPVGRAVAIALSSPVAIGNSINHFATEPQLTDHASLAVVRTDAARQVDGWDEELLVNEDVDFDHRLLQAGWLIGYDPGMLARWRVQETIGKLFRQFRRYGRGKGRMIVKNGREAIRARHLIPPLFVVGTVAMLAGGFFRPVLWLPLLPYAGLVAWATAKVWRTRDRAVDTSLAALPLCFVAVHTAWGLGMIEGSILGMQPARASGHSTLRTEQPR